MPLYLDLVLFLIILRGENTDCGCCKKHREEEQGLGGDLESVKVQKLNQSGLCKTQAPQSCDSCHQWALCKAPVGEGDRSLNLVLLCLFTCFVSRVMLRI